MEYGHFPKNVTREDFISDLRNTACKYFLKEMLSITESIERIK